MSIRQLIQKEIKRQKRIINLIPSENYVSKDVLAALGSPLTNKYAEGKSHQRYYFGNEVMDQIEDRTKELVYKAFRISPRKYGVNVQPYSGSIANLAVYLAAVGPGGPEKLRNGAGKILAMSLEHGGHLTHGHPVSWTGKLFNFKHYGVGYDGFIDYGRILELAREFKPRLVVCGGSAYPRKIDFKKFRQIADDVGALLMADIAHIAGLIVSGVHPSPFPYADIVTTTTQKTLRGPRGAIIISKTRAPEHIRRYVLGARPSTFRKSALVKYQKSKLETINLAENIDKAVFPGLQGGPQLHTIAAMGVCLEEALKPSFKKYARQTVANAKALATELKRLGFSLISGGTDNHLMLIDVTPLGLTGKEAGEQLERAGIIVNKNMIPYDTRKPWDPSGIRLGTPAVTTQRMKEKDMVRIARKIWGVLTEN